MTAVPAAQISAVIAWAARLSAIPAASMAETAAYLTAKAAVLERIAAERAAGGWLPEAARDAAARAREAADTAALAAAADITTLED